MQITINRKSPVIFVFFGLLFFYTFPGFVAEAASDGSPDAAQLALPSTDINAPTVKHTPPQTRDDEGGLQFNAEVNDNVAVRSVTLFYRAPSTQEFKTLTMQRQLSNSDIYSTRIDKSLLPNDGIEYYIKAEDTSGNTLLHGYSFSPIILSFEGSTNTVAADPESIAAFDKDAMPGASHTPLWKNKWLWIGVGAVAVAVAASSNSSDGGSPSATPGGPSVPVVVTTPPLN